MKYAKVGFAWPLIAILILILLLPTSGIATSASDTVTDEQQNLRAKIERFWGDTQALDEAASINTEQETTSQSVDDRSARILASVDIGPISHIIENVESLAIIPESRVSDKNRRYAKPLEAKPDNVWLIVRGQSINRSADTRKFTSKAISLTDGSSNVYKPSWLPNRYQPESMRLKRTSLAAGERKRWLAFFEVPEDAQDFKIKVSNLGEIENYFITLDLDEDQLPIRKVTGAISHQVFRLLRLNQLPAEWTIEKYKDSAKVLPATVGNDWIVVQGKTTNHGKDARKLSTSSYVIVDESGNEYKQNFGVARYQPPETAIKSGWLQAGNSKAWTLFFQVPESANILQLRAGNLRWVKKETAMLSFVSPTPMEQVEGSDLPTTVAINATPAATLKNVGDSNHKQKSTSAPNVLTYVDLVGLGAVTGDIEHQLISAEILAQIPDDRLTAKWRERAVGASLPAPENTVWVHIVGRSKNNSLQERSLFATFRLLDQQQREFLPDISNSQYYIEESRSVVSNNIGVGQLREWEVYFLVFQDARNLRLKLDDLTFRGEVTTEIPLPINPATIQAVASKTLE